MRAPSLLLTLFLPHCTTALHSNFLSDNDVIEFMANGHVYLKDVLPQLREESFHVAHTHARNEASKAYERYSIDRMGCNETGMDYLSRVENGDGPHALKDCFEYVKEHRHEKKFRKKAKPFYQLVDLHEHSKLIGDIAMGEHLASIAADLLQVDRVRLFQTRTFRKVPSNDTTLEQIFNHATFMHTDLKMVPIDTNHFFTFWCPLRNVTSDDSILTYARGSHRDISDQVWYDNASPREIEEAEKAEKAEEEPSKDILAHRRQREKMEKMRKFRRMRKCPSPPKEPYFIFALPDEPVTKIPPLHLRRGVEDPFDLYETSDEEDGEQERIESEFSQINDHANERYDIDIYEKINVGDCIAHHGWLLHGATSQRSSSGPREAIALSYVHADDYKLLSAEDRKGLPFLDGEFEDEIMFWQWYYDVRDGAIIDHPKLPLVWPQSDRIEAKMNETKDCDSCDDTKSVDGVAH